MAIPEKSNKGAARMLRQQAVALTGRMHVALTELAAQRTRESGVKITLRELVELALLAKYPELAESSDAEGAQIATPPQPAGTGPSAAAPATLTVDREEELFAVLVEIALLEPDAIAQSATIEALPGTVVGTFAQPIRVRDLAYHLRSTSAAVATLGELIADYEESGA